MRLSKLLKLWALVALSVRFGAAITVQHATDLPSLEYDFIIVGGGTAGNVVANRLSENPNHSILVLEAGGSHEGIQDIQIPFYSPRLVPNTAWDWNYTTVPQEALNGRSVPFERGYVLGGSSSVNVMAYTRASSDDYDRYARVTGDPGWSWSHIQKYIRRNERFTPPSDNHNTTGQYDPSVHGFDGMTSVSLPGFSYATDDKVFQALEELSEEFPYNRDFNSGSPLGVGWMQSTINNGERDSSATSYLGPKFIKRHNLDVLLHAQVLRLVHTGITDGKHTFGSVEFVQSRTTGPRMLVKARKEVILSAGPVGSPLILLHSGIGDSVDLTRVGIEPLVHLPSVGRNLSDHPLVPNLWTVNTTDAVETVLRDPVVAARALDEWQKNRTGILSNGPFNQLGWMRVRNADDMFKEFGDPSAGPKAAHFEFIIQNGPSRKKTPPTGNFFGILTAVVSPASRGSVSIGSNNAFDAPIINPRYMDSDLDMFIMREAIRSAHRFVAASAWKGYLGPAVYNLQTDAELNEFIRTNMTNLHHPAGTAAMSAKNASYGVVDPDLRVKGVAGLRIIDSSIFPFVPSAHAMAPTYIIAERGSELISQAW